MSLTHKCSKLLAPLHKQSENSPGALGPAGVGLLSALSGRRTLTEEAKAAQKWPSCQWEHGHLLFNRVQSLKTEGCEEKTHIRRGSISSGEVCERSGMAHGKCPLAVFCLFLLLPI